jgi:hypothetical protein
MTDLESKTMTTAKQAAANRRNAAHSTGPKTLVGRARSSKNALTHGVLCSLPVVPGRERPEDWGAHREGIVRSLAPVGNLEEALADRVALCSWRLKRVADYETAVIAVGLEKLDDQFQPAIPAKKLNWPGLGQDEEERLTDQEALGKALAELDEKRDLLHAWEGVCRLHERLPEMPDETPIDGDEVEDMLGDIDGGREMQENENEEEEDDFEHEDKGFLDRAFLTDLGIPEDNLGNAFSWDGLTAGLVRKAVTRLAKGWNTSPEKLFADALRMRKEFLAETTAKIKALERMVKDLRRRLKVKKDQLTRVQVFPDGDTLLKIARYEAHLSRQMIQSLHELQRLQAVRAGAPITLPAALDVTMEASESVAQTIEHTAAG